jgi:hypothetical protein
MSAIEKVANRTAILVGIAGLVVGCLFGWLAIGWGLWPVQYVGEAYTHELSNADKVQYMAALVDSYSLRRQVDMVRQRLAGWSTADKVTTLAELYAQYESQGAAPEAQQIVTVASALKQAEGWDPNVVNTVLGNLAAKYVAQDNKDYAQFISLFTNEIGLVAAVPAEEAAPVVTPAQAPASSGVIGWLLPVLVVLLLVVLIALVFLFLVRRRGAAAVARRGTPTTASEWVSEEGGALLARRSTYQLGMDTFDESFSIEAGDGAFKGECGMGISEVMGEDTPRKVMAFEVWLFDKSDIRTITKVLLSDYAYNNEALRNKLSARGETILAQPAASVLLETAALSVEATVDEMQYGEGDPAGSYFNTMTVSLVARTKAATTTTVAAGGG